MKDRNVTNPRTFGAGVTDAATVAEEHARVGKLERMLGEDGLAVLGLEYAQRLREAILDKQGVVPIRVLGPEDPTPPPLRGI